ncbi:cysteine proteinase [Neoconidiobolus thromboides FSU 785]|nr:cysteine proteinase [Neoconidiobolus thromboides FSU 785]
MDEYQEKIKLPFSLKKFKKIFSKETKSSMEDVKHKKKVMLNPMEYKNQLAQIVNILKQQGILRSQCDIEHYFKLCNYDVYETTQYLTCLALAEVGILVSVNETNQLLGVENAAGTSCYIDTILFAMYSHETTFDCLLQSKKLQDKLSESLQTLCRFFVNLLRSNLLVRAEIVESIRKKLIECGWGTNKYSQEDAGEFFLFLCNLFQLPYLPFNLQLIHGAKLDPKLDTKLIEDRILPLSLPELNPNNSTKRFITIEDLLLDYFYSNKISGLRRSIEINPNEEKAAITDAWSVLKLLPFYTSKNELSNINILKESELNEPDLILPLMIKRYKKEFNKSHHLDDIKRDNRGVTLSCDINFNNFIKKMDSAIEDKSKNEYRLELKSVICHIGTTLQSGHYIVFVKDSNTNDWVQMDDLKNEKVQRYSSVKQATQAFEIMARNSYILFYKLKVINHSSNSNNNTNFNRLRSNTAMSMDAKLARNMQALEFIERDSYKDKSCAMQ